MRNRTAAVDADSNTPATELDRRFMREALRLAARVRGRTAPNPMVGAIIVRAGRRIAGGLHVQVGRPHAEAVALAKAGARARGATLYVTLEPCAHHGHTPPCVDAVLAARVQRVVIGVADPDPRTSGRSIERLRQAGVQVTVGVESEACRRLNRGFESRLRRGRPFTQLKLAASLDGRVATRTGASRWISSPPARAFVHQLRARVDAIAVGSETARLDDPELTARRGERVLHRPRRIVIDSRLGLSAEAKLLDRSRPGSTWLLTSAAAPTRRRRALEAAGARLIDVPLVGEHLDLELAWKTLGRLGVNDVLVEGGGVLGSVLLRAGLVDELYLFLAPLLIGGDGRSVLGSLGVDRLEEALRPVRIDWRRFGPDLCCVAQW